MTRKWNFPGFSLKKRHTDLSKGFSLPNNKMSFEIRGVPQKNYLVLLLMRTRSFTPRSYLEIKTSKCLTSPLFKKYKKNLNVTMPTDSPKWKPQWTPGSWCSPNKSYIREEARIVVASLNKYGHCHNIVSDHIWAVMYCNCYPFPFAYVAMKANVLMMAIVARDAMVP